MPYEIGGQNPRVHDGEHIYKIIHSTISIEIKAYAELKD